EQVVDDRQLVGDRPGQPDVGDVAVDVQVRSQREHGHHDGEKTGHADQQVRPQPAGREGEEEQEGEAQIGGGVVGSSADVRVDVADGGGGELLRVGGDDEADQVGHVHVRRMDGGADPLRAQ